LVVLLGIVAQLFFPSLIPSGDFDSDAWHGVVAFKNDWARIVVLTMVALLCWSRRSLRAYLFIGFLTLVGLGLIIAAHSIGALIILIAMLLLSKMIGALRWRPRILVVASIASALMLLSTSYLIVQNIDKATAVLGRDSSLTGRVDIWKIALSSILENPIHGYGYRAFWSANSQAAMTLREEFNWAINHSHNGYIELTLDLGLAGLLLLIFSYLIAGRRAIVYFRRGIGREAMWPVTYLSFFFLYQFTEGSLVSGNTIFWIVYVALCLSVTEISGTHQRVPQSESKGTVLIQALPFDRQQA
jgi:O-antigen ligase